MATSPAIKGPSTARDLGPRILELLPGRPADIARALGRKPSDGTVRRALERLATEGFAERNGHEWRRCHVEPALPEDEAWPQDFDHESRAFFARLLAWLRAQNTFRAQDRSTLESFVRSKQLAREARVAVAEHGAYTQSKGRVYKNPGVEDARQHERDALALADALILTPAARRRHGKEQESGAVDPLDDL